MEQKKNLCSQIPLSLHDRVTEAREQSGLTTAQYITNLLIEYFEMKENGGKVTMAANNTRSPPAMTPSTSGKTPTWTGARTRPSWPLVSRPLPATSPAVASISPLTSSPARCLADW